MPKKRVEVKDLSEKVKQGDYSRQFGTQFSHHSDAQSCDIRTAVSSQADR